MNRDKDSIYAYLCRLFYEYLNPPSEMAVNIDGLLWKAAHDLASVKLETKVPVDYLGE